MIYFPKCPSVSTVQNYVPNRCTVRNLNSSQAAMAVSKGIVNLKLLRAGQRSRDGSLGIVTKLRAGMSGF